MTKLFCQSCGNIYVKDELKKITICPRCGSLSYSNAAAAIHRFFKCEKCKRIFKLSEVAARYFARHKCRPECPKCKYKVTAISTNTEYLKDSGQAQKKTNGINKDLEQFGLKTW